MVSCSDAAPDKKHEYRSHHSPLHHPQSNTLRPYLSCVRASLTAALTLENFGSQVVERHNSELIQQIRAVVCFYRQGNAILAAMKRPRQAMSIHALTSPLYRLPPPTEPEVEVASTPEVLLTPLVISRNENERVLIEVSES